MIASQAKRVESMLQLHQQGMERPSDTLQRILRELRAMRSFLRLITMHEDDLKVITDGLPPEDFPAFPMDLVNVSSPAEIAEMTAGEVSSAEGAPEPVGAEERQKDERTPGLELGAAE